MAGFWSNVARALRGLLPGQGPVQESEQPTEAPVPQEYPPEYEEQVPEEQYEEEYGGEEEVAVEEYGDDEVYNVPRKQYTLPQVCVGHPSGEGPSISGVYNLLTERPGADVQNMLVTGILEEEYPGKEGETVITLAYAVDSQTLDEVFNELDEMSTATDYINEIVGLGTMNANYFWSEVLRICFVYR